MIGGYDLMKTARLVVNVENGLVWSRRPESATKGPIGPNPEFPVFNKSVHSSVSMIELQYARHVVVPRPTDPPTATAVEPRAPPTPPEESSESVALTDVDQTDVKRAYTDRPETRRRFCTDASQSEDKEDVVATVAEINQCCQEQVDAFRFCFACCMLSDTEYSDFEESDEDEKWEKYQQDNQEYSRALDEPAETDIRIVPTSTWEAT